MNGPKLFNKVSISTILIALFFLASFSANALTTVTVKNGTSGIAYNNYRWVIEEDQTFDIKAGQTCSAGAVANYQECLSLNFHKSYMPVIAQGSTSLATPFNWSGLGLDPAKRYYISILPEQAAAQTMGGAQIAAGQANVEIIVTTNNLPTAQIRVFVFNDNAPTNNIAQPGELGLAGFDIKLEDAGGRYGVSGQQVLQDVYGNPLGTTYTATGAPIPGSGDGTLLTLSNGERIIKNLAPGKYGIRVVPPTGSNFIQTSTIEGTAIIDAWVKANEPPYFAEFGPPGPHVFVGFVDLDAPSKLTGVGATITGKVSAIHNSRPPLFDFFSGAPINNCVVALNENNGGIDGANLHVTKCDNNSNFSISNVPPGNYSLSFWDESLDYIFGQYAITVGPTDAALTVNPSLFAWFARMEQSVFYDTNGNGKRDVGEVGMPEVATGIRWRDGTVYQGFPTDTTGEAPYDQVFPFFSWLVAEVDYSRYKATGVTVTVDGGGVLAPGANFNPQIQAGGGTTRTEAGPVLTQAFQTFLGQTSKIEWGKQVYSTAEIRAGVNGGISGIVYYAVTRAEDDPKFAAPEVWEPGIPRIQVELYNVDPLSGGIKDNNANGVIDKADVDNYPLGWSTGGVMGPEDFDNHPNNGAGNPYSVGDAIQITTTDSWDDNVPTNCVITATSPVFVPDPATNTTFKTDCFDGLRNFNQIRPGVFDGGYAFTAIPAGDYIVATGDHRAYKTVKEEDKNVDFGVTFIQPNLLPPTCVGTRSTVVPLDYSLFPVTDSNGAKVSPLGSGTSTPLCNEKLVTLNGGKNAAVDFYLFTDVPVAGHIMGFILNDLANEFDTNSPTFGEKYSPPFLPVSIRDWKGNVIGRTYSDRWGSFNVLVPSTYTENLPSSSGISPNMLTTCMNDPGPVRDATGTMVIDPYYQKQYSQFCYTFNYMPGVTTYLDTPVLPIAAFAGISQEALDCDYQDGTPVIWQTLGSVAGPIVTFAGDTLKITSAGLTTVTNPEATLPGRPKTITRDYGFGTAPGTVTINGVVVSTLTWTNDVITLNIPNSGNLEIKRANGRRTQAGIHVTVGGNVVTVPIGGSIQATINSPSVTPGTTVVIPPGTYSEMVVMYKPIKLQGSGASTVINSFNVPSSKLLDWDTFVKSLINRGVVDLLPKQEVGSLLPEQITLFTEAGAGITVLAKNLGPKAGGFGKLPVLINGQPVVIKDEFGEDVELKETIARIDGISLTGSDNGGGIVVNGYANDLEISNNRVYGNYGVYSGGIRVGHPTLINVAGTGYEDARNSNINIHNNYVIENGSGNGYGGGISMNHGSKSYKVTNNYVCGNFTSGNGGGIGHIGLGSPTDGAGRSLIADNVVIFNQSFKQQTSVAGGGIFIGGAPSLTARTLANPTPLSDGAGKVIVDSNLIQGNNAGAGNGGGIMLSNINGRDILKGSLDQLYKVTITNNIIVNNVAGLAGGGVSLSNAVRVSMVNNTIAHNDSSATSGEAFCDPVNTTVCSAVLSVPRVAGVVSYAHTKNVKDSLASFLVGDDIDKFGLFSNPKFANNIVWKNRSFYFEVLQNNPIKPFQLVFSSFDDYGVIGAVGNLKPLSSVLTNTTGTDATNTNAAPGFVNHYFNAPVTKEVVVNQIEFTTILDVQPAFDEGGNFIDLRYGPLSLTLPSISPNNDLGSNYRITAASSAIGLGDEGFLGSIPQLDFDIDNDPRTGRVDSGADQFIIAPPEVVNGIALNSFGNAPVANQSASTGGGCTLQREARFDPLLPLLMLLGLVYFLRSKMVKNRLLKSTINGEV